MDLVGNGMVKLLQWNEARLDRSVPKPDGVINLTEFGFTSAIQDAWQEIREEWDAMRQDGVRLPETADVAGFDQGNVGSWTNFVVYSYGRWIEFNRQRCPRTTELLGRVPGLQVGGFSVLAAGTRLPAHRGFNRGALRFQVGIEVPEPPGSCALRVGSEVHTWQEGNAVVFDHSVEHEAWNEGNGDRAVLFVEFCWPLPGMVGLVNRLTQRTFGLAALGVPKRVDELERILNG